MAVGNLTQGKTIVINSPNLYKIIFVHNLTFKLELWLLIVQIYIE